MSGALAAITTEQEFYTETKLNPRYYMESCLKIRDKKGRLVPFMLNRAQRKLDDVVMELKRLGRAVRVIILKARQEGISTYCQGYLFHGTATEDGIQSLSLGHDLDSTNYIFSISQTFLNHLPKPVRPQTRYRSRKEIYFDSPTELGTGLCSSMKVGTAGDLDVGRGSTVRYVHGSEVASWPNPEAVMLSLSQAVPDDPDTAIFLESTAKGLGGYFYNEWNKAVAGKSSYWPLFIPWWMMPEYATPLNTLEPQYHA